MEATIPTWFLYLLQCRSGAYYAGITTDLPRRFDQHVQGKGAKYTRANPPVALVASKVFESRSQASKAEAALKRLPRNRKIFFFQP